MAHIRIISPSGAIDPEYIEGATQRLLSWGHTVSVSRHAAGRVGRFAASDDDRLSDLTEALRDYSLDYILCARGGYGLQRIVDRIDRSLPADYDFSRMPAIVGFSDITALHAWVRTHGVRSLHAPMCKHLATMDPESLPMRYMRRALDGQPLEYDFAIPSAVIGGNLSVLYGLQGTPYGLTGATAPDGETLLIEDICERHYHVERMLLGLKMSGVFDRIGGLIVGQFTDCDDDPGMGETLRETILRVVGERTYPIIVDAPFGHVDLNLPIWLNDGGRV